MNYRIKDISLAENGKKKIDWAEVHMPVLVNLRKRFEAQLPLKGVKVAGCLHVTKETGVLIRTIKALGAEIAWCGCNPLSTQDDVAACVAKEGISIFASRGVSNEQYYDDIHSTMKIKPNITIDDGADLTVEMHNDGYVQDEPVYGGTEETTTGVIRLRAMQSAGKLKYPVIAVNDAETKHDFDNVYGTGQSALDGIIRATNILIAGKIFITTTGCKDVITGQHFGKMKDGTLLANAGHFNVEISVNDLEAMSVSIKQINDNNQEYLLKNGNKIYLIGEGRLVNLAAAEGHPSEVMDMSFANQLLSVLKLANLKGSLTPAVYDVEKSQDQEIAKAKLESMGLQIDVLTPEQRIYLEGFGEGT